MLPSWKNISWSLNGIYKGQFIMYLWNVTLPRPVKRCRILHYQLYKFRLKYHFFLSCLYLLQVLGDGPHLTVTITNGFRLTLAIGSRSVPLQPKGGTVARTGSPSTACSTATLGGTGNPIIKMETSGWVTVRKAGTELWPSPALA